MKTLFESLNSGERASFAAPLPQREPDYLGLTGKRFAKAVLDSQEFKQYIVDGIMKRDLPPAVLCRLIDHGWGKPPDRVEHTGTDGKPIEMITEVRRVVVRVPDQRYQPEDDQVYTTH